MSIITLLEEAQAAIAKLSNEDAGALIKALISGDETPELSDIAGIVYPFIKGQVERLEDIREKRSTSGKKGGWNSKTEANDKQTESKNEANGKQNGSKTEANDKQTESKPQALNHNHNHNLNLNLNHIESEKRTRFTPPTVEEVEEYAKEKGLRIQAERFVDFYASKGWKVGSSGMKDWKAAVRNWASRDKPPDNGEKLFPGIDYTKLLYKGGA